MAAQKGKELLLKIHDGSSSYDDANYVVIGGMNTNKISYSGEQIDITSKDSAGFKESLEGAGNVSISITGNGVFLDDASFQRIHDHFIAQTHPESKIIVPDFVEYTGKFEIESLGLNGDSNTAITYEIGLKSSGPVTVSTL